MYQMLAAAKRPTLALDVDIVQDNFPIEVAPKIFIGSIHAAFNQEALLSLKITHVSSPEMQGHRDQLVKIATLRRIQDNHNFIIFFTSIDFECLSSTPIFPEELHLLVSGC